MAVRREIILDSIEVRPVMKQIGVTKVVNTYQDDQLVDSGRIVNYYSHGDDLSSEDDLVQNIANNYWSTL